VTVADAAGGTLPEVLRRLALTQNGEQICLWLKEQAGKINRQVDDLLKLHLAIPAPGSVPAYDEEAVRTAYAPPAGSAQVAVVDAVVFCRIQAEPGGERQQDPVE